MAIPKEHHLTLVEVQNLPYKYVVTCDCQWQALCHTGMVAHRWIMSHAQAQTLRGNVVFIDITKEKMEELRAAAVSAG
jgi:hypothetical protein